MKSLTAAALLLTMFLSVPTARAEWKMLDVPGIKPNVFTVAGGEITVDSRMGASFLYRAATPAERDAAILSWRWRVDRAIPATDLTAPGADDRELAVHLWFPGPPEGAGLLRRFKDTLTAALGYPVPGRTLTYVWGGKGARGVMFANPHNAPDGQMVILRPGGTPTGRWFTERIDFAADFRRAFGTAPPPLGYLAVSGDSDDTGGVCMGHLADLRFGA